MCFDQPSAKPSRPIAQYTMKNPSVLLTYMMTKKQNFVTQTPDQTNTISRIMLESIFIKTCSVFWPACYPAQPPHCAVYHEKPFSAVDRHIDCSPVTQPIISYTFFLVLFYHSALPLFVVLLKRIIWRIVSGTTVKYPWLISESG